MNPKENQNLNVDDMGLELPPEEPTVAERKEELAHNLHKGTALPNLRTYQGDIAEFIKSKDQSLSGIALKQQEKRREEGTLNGQKSTGVNFMIYVISICLIIGAAFLVAYLFNIGIRGKKVETVADQSILSSKSKVVVNLEELPNNLKEALNSLRSEQDDGSGIVEIVVTDSVTRGVAASSDVIQKLKLNMPSALTRSIDNKFMIGLYGENNENSDFFLIFKVKDYGIAYRDMLEWESSMALDLEEYLRNQEEAKAGFQDLIVRNKDTRAVFSVSGELKLLYTFLNKETVLITESETALKSLLDSFVAAKTVK